MEFTARGKLLTAVCDYMSNQACWHRQDQTSLHYLLQQDPDNPRTEEFKLLWSTELTKGQTLSEETVDALRLQVRVTESAFHLLLQTISEHPWATNASAIAYNSLGIWNRATDQFEYSGANMIQPSINRRDNLSRRLVCYRPNSRPLFRTVLVNQKAS